MTSSHKNSCYMKTETHDHTKICNIKLEPPYIQNFTMKSIKSEPFDIETEPTEATGTSIETCCIPGTSNGKICGIKHEPVDLKYTEEKPIKTETSNIKFEGMKANIIETYDVQDANSGKMSGIKRGDLKFTKEKPIKTETSNIKLEQMKANLVETSPVQDESSGKNCGIKFEPKYTKYSAMKNIKEEASNSDMIPATNWNDYDDDDDDDDVMIIEDPDGKGSNSKEIVIIDDEECSDQHLKEMEMVLLEPAKKTVPDFLTEKEIYNDFIEVFHNFQESRLSNFIIVRPYGRNNSRTESMRVLRNSALFSKMNFLMESNIVNGVCTCIISIDKQVISQVKSTYICRKRAVKRLAAEKAYEKLLKFCWTLFVNKQEGGNLVKDKITKVEVQQKIIELENTDTDSSTDSKQFCCQLGYPELKFVNKPDIYTSASSKNKTFRNFVKMKIEKLITYVDNVYLAFDPTFSEFDKLLICRVAQCYNVSASEMLVNNQNHLILNKVGSTSDAPHWGRIRNSNKYFIEPPCQEKLKVLIWNKNLQRNVKNEVSVKRENQLSTLSQVDKKLIPYQPVSVKAENQLSTLSQEDTKFIPYQPVSIKAENQLSTLSHGDTKCIPYQPVSVKADNQSSTLSLEDTKWPVSVKLEDQSSALSQEDTKFIPYQPVLVKAENQLPTLSKEDKRSLKRKQNDTEQNAKTSDMLNPKRIKGSALCDYYHYSNHRGNYKPLYDHNIPGPHSASPWKPYCSIQHVLPYDENQFPLESFYQDYCDYSCDDVGPSDYLQETWF